MPCGESAQVSLEVRVEDNVRPGFSEQCAAIFQLGQLLYYTVSPYIDISMALSQQLQTLSAATHLGLFLYANWDAKSHFMPSQLYGDLQIMIQNVFFCVAKQKILDHDGQFFLCEQTGPRSKYVYT